MHAEFGHIGEEEAVFFINNFGFDNFKLVITIPAAPDTSIVFIPCADIISKRLQERKYIGNTVVIDIGKNLIIVHRGIVTLQ